MIFITGATNNVYLGVAILKSQLRVKWVIDGGGQWLPRQVIPKLEF